jgi:hypothetical protein
VVAPVRVTDPLDGFEVVPVCAVHGAGIGFGFVVGCVGLLVGRGAGFGGWCGWERICGIGLVGVGLKSCFGARTQRFGCVWCR